MISKEHFGTSGNDILTGSYLTADTFFGSLGNDTYIIQDLEDSIAENTGMGLDTVKSSINYMLGANLENLTLTGGAWEGTGNELNNVITGNLLIGNHLSGLGGNDILTGGAGNDTLKGDEGNDRLTGGAGNDYLDGGAGNDIVNGGTGADQMTGGRGNDTYYVEDFSDVVDEYYYGDGVDKVVSSVNYSLGYGIENLAITGDAFQGHGNELSNVITGNSLLNSQLFGYFGNDALTGGAGNDFLVGDEGNDRLTGGLGNDQLNGDDGDDILNGGAGQDYMMGGAGNDTYYVDDISDMVDESYYNNIIYNNGLDKVISSVSYQLGSGVENLALTGQAVQGHGNELGNVITGNSLLNNLLFGYFGNDALTGGAGNDLLVGDAGNDRLTGGFGNDHLDGGDGDDILSGGAGQDYMMGGVGNDTYYVDDAFDMVDEDYGSGVDIVTSSVGYQLGYGIENLILAGNATYDNATATGVYGGGNELNNSISSKLLTNVDLSGFGGNDVLTGGAGNDHLDGGKGDDRLTGGLGGDVLYGGAGDDTLNGGADVDYMLGGTGNDTYYVDALYEMVYEYGDEGVDRVISSVDFNMSESIENLTLTGSASYGSGNELDNVISGNLLNNVNLSGFDGDDVLTSGAGNDHLEGGEGDDRLTAGLGHDFLKGGAGDDILNGGDGDDILEAGTGIDAMNGGSGNDKLFAEGGDSMTGGLGMDIFGGNLSDSTIRDFQKGTDLISFDVYTYSSTHMGTFTFVGQQAFTGMDQLRFENVGTSGVLYGNIDGDLAPDFQVTLTGVTSIDITDLQLIVAV